jgi:hypothetical protein
LAEGDDADPFVVFNILPELAQPFNTKQRAPFKAVFETVRLSEIIAIKSSQLQTASSNLIQADDNEMSFGQQQ